MKGLPALPPLPAAYAREPAPDLFKCLHTLLRGVRDMGGGVPALAQQRAPVVQRSSDLLACYGILAEVAAACGAQEADPNPDQVNRMMLWSPARHL